MNSVAVANRMVPGEELLGYVMAHEIGHLLLGIHHSNGGIMTECWTLRQIGMMRRRMLLFDKSECTAIREALKTRAVRAKGLCRNPNVPAGLESGMPDTAFVPP